MKTHHTVINYKSNYESIKRGLETFSSRILEQLHYEADGLSEKGLRKLLKNIGMLRQNLYSNCADNKEIFFDTSNAIENFYKPAILNLREQNKYLKNRIKELEQANDS